MLPLGSNHLLCYVRLDERANDLRTTTSPTQALSDEYDNNSGLVPVEHSRGHPDRQSHLQTTVKARLNDCHRRLKRYKNKTQQLHDKLKQLILTELLDIVTTIADKRDNKATERARTGHQQKLTGLLRNKEQRRSKPDGNWVRNISSRPLDRNETRLLSYGQKHSVTPKRIPTKAIVSSVEAALSRQRELSESTKGNIRSRIASTIQSALQHGSNSTKDEQHALKRRGHSYSTSRQRTSYCCHGQN